MLVLTREEGDTVVVDVPPSEGWTRVLVVHCGRRPGGVRLGFDAPREVVVHRSEVMRRIEAEGRERSEPC